MQKRVKIDLITQDAKKDAYKLIAVAQGPWPASEVTDHMRALQEKLYDYVDAAVEGGLAAQYPQSCGKKVVIRLDCYDTPQAEMEQFFNRFVEHIRSNPTIQAKIAQTHHVKEIDFEFSWATIPQEPKTTPVRPSLFSRLFGK
jgi:hypothetical protein